jgi:hypothetical protein
VPDSAGYASGLGGATAPHGHRAHFSAHMIGRQSIFIEGFILYELRTFS